MENLSRMTVFVGLERPNVSEWIPIVRTSAGNSFDQAEGSGIFVDLVLADAQWHMRQVENHARYLRVMDNRTVPTVAGRVDGCERTILVQHNG